MIRKATRQLTSAPSRTLPRKQRGGDAQGEPGPEQADHPHPADRAGVGRDEDGRQAEGQARRRRGRPRGRRRCRRPRRAGSRPTESTQQAQIPDQDADLARQRRSHQAAQPPSPAKKKAPESRPTSPRPMSNSCVQRADDRADVAAVPTDYGRGEDEDAAAPAYGHAWLLPEAADRVAAVLEVAASVDTSPPTGTWLEVTERGRWEHEVRRAPSPPGPAEPDPHLHQDAHPDLGGPLRRGDDRGRRGGTGVPDGGSGGDPSPARSTRDPWNTNSAELHARGIFDPRRVAVARAFPRPDEPSGAVLARYDLGTRAAGASSKYYTGESLLGPDFLTGLPRRGLE